VENRVDYDGELYEGFFIAPGARPDPQQCATASSLVEFEMRSPSGGLADQAGVTPPARGVYAGFWATGAQPQRQLQVNAGVYASPRGAFYAQRHRSSVAARLRVQPRRQGSFSRIGHTSNNFMRRRQKPNAPPGRKRP
jgi:hypothetical protein